jgi:imidazoleglycerol-phosphate dehydratase
LRQGESSRKTLETEISIQVNLDGSGKARLDTKLPFLQHMLSTLTKHSGFDLTLVARGDLPHHIAEDIAIVLGRAVGKAIKENEQIERFGNAIIPMDDALVLCALDLASRPYADVKLQFASTAIDSTRTEDIIHFFQTLAYSIPANIHILQLRGENDHHIAEAAFKAFARSVKGAVGITDGMGVPSTKGVFD